MKKGKKKKLEPRPYLQVLEREECVSKMQAIPS